MRYEGSEECEGAVHSVETTVARIVSGRGKTGVPLCPLRVSAISAYSGMDADGVRRGGNCGKVVRRLWGAA